MVEMYVANTDNKWFDFLRSTGPHQEINFWKPSQQIFKAINEGGLFVFRLKSPRNLIGGYGILASSINAPISLAWDSLGISNGVANLEELVQAIAKYRDSRDTDMYSQIGCRVLIEPVFFNEEEWFEVPIDWSSNIVTGKVYDSRTVHGEKLLNRLQERTNPNALFKRDRLLIEGMGEKPQEKYGAPITVLPRLGQGAFRMKVSDAYKLTCGVSDTRVLPALDAAHIRPFASGGTHRVDNGILLRKDIHCVFDAGFATFDTDMKFVVSKMVKERFNNGHEYRKMHGKKLELPILPSFWPSQANLEWHRHNSLEKI